MEKQIAFAIVDTGNEGTRKKKGYGTVAKQEDK